MTTNILREKDYKEYTMRENELLEKFSFQNNKKSLNAFMKLIYDRSFGQVEKLLFYLTKTQKEQVTMGHTELKPTVKGNHLYCKVGVSFTIENEDGASRNLLQELGIDTLEAVFDIQVDKYLHFYTRECITKLLDKEVEIEESKVLSTYSEALKQTNDFSSLLSFAHMCLESHIDWYINGVRCDNQTGPKNILSNKDGVLILYKMLQNCPCNKVLGIIDSLGQYKPAIFYDKYHIKKESEHVVFYMSYRLFDSEVRKTNLLHDVGLESVWGRIDIYPSTEELKEVIQHYNLDCPSKKKEDMVDAVVSLIDSRGTNCDKAKDVFESFKDVSYKWIAQSKNGKDLYI